QYASAKLFGLYYYENMNSYPLFLFNFLIYCLILVVHYRFSRLIFKDNILALISVLMYSALTNSYLYLRHALPYDMSLLILYQVFYVVVKNAEVNIFTYKQSFILGLISFFGYIVYPGYFTLFLAISL